MTTADAPARSAGRTPVTVLTGFLGAGKTTLLNRVLTAPGMARMMVIINEFGEVGLDHLLTAASDDEVVVLENGCLCCTVFSDLIGTLNRLWHAREAGEMTFDHVLIETSGLADPAPVLQAFLSDPTLEGLYRLAGVIALADAVNGQDTLDRHAESVRQIALADQVLITKLDLAEDAATAEAALTARIRAINPAAAIRRADDPNLDLAALIRGAGLDPSKPDQALAWLNAEAYAPHDHDHDHEDHDHGHDHHHPHRDAIASFCLVREAPSSREALRLLLTAIEQNLGPRLLRVKGLVNVTEDPDHPAVIQGAQHLLHNLVHLPRWPSADRRTRIVFITEGMRPEMVEEMVGMLDRVAVRTAAARARAQAERERA